MNVSEQIDNFINLNTKREDGTWEWRTRDALNIALARLDAAERKLAAAERTIQAQAERIRLLEHDATYETIKWIEDLQAK